LKTIPPKLFVVVTHKIKHTFQNKKRSVVIPVLVLIVLLGTFLRVYNIDSKELWYDEAFTANIIDQPYQEIFTLSKADFHPPLYYMVLKSWVGVWGDTEVSLRFPSVIFGVLTIAVAFYLAQFITKDNKKALWVALFIATNPFLIVYSKEARSYSLMAFLIVLTALVFFKALQDRKYLQLSLLLPILFLTHYMTIFGIVFYSVWTFYRDKKFALYLIPLLVIIMIWIPIIRNNTNTQGLQWISELSWSRIPESVHAFVLGVSSSSTGSILPVNPFPIPTNIISYSILAGIIVLIFLVKNVSRKVTLLALCGIIPIILIIGMDIVFDKQAYLERYLIGYASLLIICVVIIQKRVIILLPYVLLCIYLVITFMPSNFGYREFANHIADKPVVIADATVYINAKYYTKDIKLQPGDWKEWAIITDEDIYNPSNPRDDYYLVSVEKIEGWQSAYTVGRFNFYEYDGSNQK